MDEDVGSDDAIGTCRIDLAKTRTYGSDRVQAPCMATKGGKQHGFVQVSLAFTKNLAMMRPPAPAAHAPPPAYYPPPVPAPAAYYGQQQQQPQYHPVYAPAPHQPSPYAQPAYAPLPSPYGPPAVASSGGVLDAGELLVTLEFAKGLKDMDLFGRQDPYCFVTCGGMRYRSKTNTNGGKVRPISLSHSCFNHTIHISLHISPLPLPMSPALPSS